MSELTLEGWRIRRRPRASRGRAPRIVIVGDGAGARLAAARLAASRAAEILLSVESPGRAASLASDSYGEVRPVILLDGAAPADVVILCDLEMEDEPRRVSRTRDVALWAIRTCPQTVLIIASADGLSLSREAARASGLPPWLILSPGGMPLAGIEAARLSRRLKVSADQICVPVIGGGPIGAPARDHHPLRRYTTVAGIPCDLVDEGDAPRAAGEEALQQPAPSSRALAAAASSLARAVVRDSRRVLSCGAWVSGSFGIAGGFVTVPVRVGARGAEEPLPMRLTLEERSGLQRTASYL
ncbi:MAG TPA: hypothetical protein VFG76_00245 [Candidatus Polarisedimenticolia bacterium]|nr:hypothetical protein [Candidatus Polarisedimenticolia bacterium]